MKPERRKAQAEIIAAIQSRAGTYEVQQVMDLLGLLLEDSKNNLLVCASAEFPRVQGEAQTYDKLIRMLTRPSLKTIVSKE